jgi:hypothetical protein
VLPGVAPVPLGRDEQGREVLSWLDGDVGIEPFPQWVAEEEFLVSLGQLLRRIHDALAGWIAPPDLEWSDQIPDPQGGTLIVHADICPQNVIAKDGRAVSIIDWEFAAPGRAIWDVVSTARLCVQFTHPSRREPVYEGLDVDARLRVFLDAYDLSDPDRAIFTKVLDERRLAGARFIQGRIDRDEKAFADLWATPAGERRLVLEERWVRERPADVAEASRPR